MRASTPLQRDPAPRRRTPAPHRAALALACASALAAAPSPGAAQLSSPCEVRCGLVLAGSSYAVGTAALVAWGRHQGGVSSGTRGGLVWLGGFAATAGAGLALGGDGDRQERAVHGSGLGVVGGSLGGLLVGSLVAPDDPARRMAYTLVGAGVGALVGGTVGALTYDGPPGVGEPAPSLSLSWRF